LDEADDRPDHGRDSLKDGPAPEDFLRRVTLVDDLVLYAATVFSRWVNRTGLLDPPLFADAALSLVISHQCNSSSPHDTGSIGLVSRNTQCTCRAGQDADRHQRGCVTQRAAVSARGFTPGHRLLAGQQGGRASSPYNVPKIRSPASPRPGMMKP